MARVLVACEFSGIVRDAFASRGHHAVSCDLLPTEKPGGHHVQGDCLRLLSLDWDLLIAHPPCTYLAVSGARWFQGREEEQSQALGFFAALWDAPVPKVCVENPVSVAATFFGRATQYVQPWQFGHGEVKKTGLWLRGLPPLSPTDVVDGREPRVHQCSPGPERWRERSRTFPGIAEAMADQWGSML